MKKIITALAIFASTAAFSQVGIGTTTPNENSLLDLRSTTKGFLLPRLTTAERGTLATTLSTTPDALEEGMQVYDTQLNAIFYWDGAAWIQQGANNIYDRNGDIAPTAAVNRTVAFTNGGSLNFDANTLFLDATNNRLGIGTTSPATTLDIPSGQFKMGLSSGYQVRMGGGYIDFHDQTGALKNNITNLNANSDLYINSLAANTTNTLINASGGNVGIGTNGPGSKLVVQGTTDGAGEKLAVFKGTGNERIRIYDHAASQGPRLELSSGAPSSIENPEGQIVLRPLSSSNSGNYRYVGINTAVGSSPGATIDIKSVGTTEAAIKVTNTSNATTFELEDNGELKFSGPLMPNNTAGTSGQVLTSAGAGASPTWTTQSASNTPNIYSTNGVIAANRTVDLAGRTLSFTNDTGTAVANQFSVDGTTFSVDALNNSVGIGTTAPSQKLHVNGTTRMSFDSGTAGTTLLTLDRPNVTNSRVDAIYYATTVGSIPANSLMLNSAGSSNPNLIFGRNSNPDIFIKAADGNVGIGTTSPGESLTVNGTSGLLGSIYRTNGAGGSEFFINPRESDGFTYLNMAPNGMYTRSNDGTIRMTVLNNGNVGIGTNVPSARLHVSGASGASGTGQYGFLNDSFAGSTSNSSFSMSILASGNIVTNTEFRAYSDARIKESKGTVNPQESLDAVVGLKIQKYAYKDVVSNGSNVKTGVFAQDVEKVFPEAVQKVREFIPNVNAKATIKLVGEETVFVGVNSSDVVVGDMIKFYVLENNVETEKIAQVAATANNQITINAKLNATEAFVFGKEVSDFRNLDYDRLTILNLSATQALNAQLEAKNAEIKELKAEKDAEIKTLKEEMEAMKKAIEALKK